MTNLQEYLDPNPEIAVKPPTRFEKQSVSQAQVALGAEGDDAQRQQALRQTLEDCDRATHLVAQLLTLSRLEAQGEKAAQASNITADDTLTGVLVRNLLDNALRYSPDGAQVSVTVQCL